MVRLVDYQEFHPVSVISIGLEIVTSGKILADRSIHRGFEVGEIDTRQRLAVVELARLAKIGRAHV